MKNKLSDKEMEIIELLREGLTRDEVAEKLGKSINTIHSQTRDVFIKLDARNLQEVLNKLSVLGIRGKQVIFYSDDGTNAEVMFCRKR